MKEETLYAAIALNDNVPAALFSLRYTSITQADVSHITARFRDNVSVMFLFALGFAGAVSCVVFCVPSPVATELTVSQGSHSSRYL